MNKTIVCLIGPSGSGKTYIGTMLANVGFNEIISHTTRKKRPGERDDIDYHFVSKEEFSAVEMIETNFYSGEWYGTSSEEVGNNLVRSDKLYQVTTFSGFEKIKSACPKVKVVSIFVEASQEKREERMSIRGDSLSSIQKRITVDTAKWDAIKTKCDFALNNDRDKSAGEILATIDNFLSQK